MEARGIRAPEGSLIEPERLAVDACAKALPGSRPETTIRSGPNNNRTGDIDPPNKVP